MTMSKSVYFWGIQNWTKVYSTFIVSTLNNYSAHYLFLKSLEFVDPESKSQAVTEYGSHVS